MLDTLLSGILTVTLLSGVDNVPQYQDYRQTYYTIEQGETQVGARDLDGKVISLQNSNVKVMDNEIMYNDSEYGYLPMVAISINDVLESKDGEYTYGVYGSVLEMSYPDGSTKLALVTDACGACAKEDKIDKWLYKADVEQDIKGVSFDYVRYGWHSNEEWEIEKLLQKEADKNDTGSIL